MKAPTQTHLRQITLSIKNYHFVKASVVISIKHRQLALKKKTLSKTEGDILMGAGKN
jgi:hypothetical protein